ncbi:MAG: hypothetical protein LBV00_08695, partial [Propionibacteriaceae bacterium]|nr:hypothetical protein [Propionibacteriaceae bacterium]
MTAAKMMTLWAIGATIIFFLLVALATARRMHAVRARARLPKRYRHLRALEHSIGWPRAGVTLAATACALWLTWSMPDHAGLFLAPTLWAGLITLGLIGIDQLVLGRTPRLDQWRPPTNVRAYFSWKPIALVIVLAGVLIYTIRWASGVATKDGRRVFGAWTTDGEAHWGWSDPFPGAYYTDPLKWMLPLLVALILAGVVVTFARHTYRAGTRYAALDRGFRRRTISDLTLALIGALGGTLATISLDIAWACAILGSNSPDNAAVVGINAVVGLCATGLCFWVEASLIFLPVVSEDKTIARMWLDTPDPTALVNPSASNSGAIALVDAALSAGAR